MVAIPAFHYLQVYLQVFRIAIAIAFMRRLQFGEILIPSAISTVTEGRKTDSRVDSATERNESVLKLNFCQSGKAKSNAT